ncbi:MAG: hypothetical protein K9G67_01770 [Bacteroidales bacterium]|nr:hypothetical protein [Bacteroidales bacterium]MCF8350173.1 hypothetical protein [Bacteroidales bacterium]MCF8375058.1 hypothetical protein [Bacteroidales bacterium]MCF8399964.1 hypothetical protein [Bacteroidales bacterium]
MNPPEADKGFIPRPLGRFNIPLNTPLLCGGVVYYIVIYLVSYQKTTGNENKSDFITECLITSVLTLNSQIINIDTTFVSDGEIYPFSQDDTIKGLKISGNVILNTDTSLVRVIFVDNMYNEYMIYECYPLISTKLDFSFDDVCDETLCLDQINPYSVKVEIINASITLANIMMSEGSCNNAESDRYASKRALDLKKVDTMNLMIQKYGMNWNADDNAEIAMYYMDKTKIYGEKYNLRGFDYYDEGV